MRLTNAMGVNVVSDSVGKTTFDHNVKCLAVRGVPAGYHGTRAELLEWAGDVLGWVMSGKRQVRISQILSLQEAAEAHRLLQARETTGKVLLVP